MWILFHWCLKMIFPHLIARTESIMQNQLCKLKGGSDPQLHRYPFTGLPEMFSSRILQKLRYTGSTKSIYMLNAWRTVMTHDDQTRLTMLLHIPYLNFPWRSIFWLKTPGVKAGLFHVVATFFGKIKFPDFPWPNYNFFPTEIWTN